MKLAWKFHAWIYRVSGGRLGQRGLAMPSLLMTSTGRRSGTPRVSPLMYIEHTEGHVVVASNAGEDSDPGWAHNLRADPRVVLRIGTKTIEARAREAHGAERDELWARFVEADPSYLVYLQRTERVIPAFVLERLE
jgi:deazaflavin-dependent oxidoreductase (nitroreductase family)